MREKTVLVREKRGRERRELRGEENVTSHIYVLLLAKFARMPGLGSGSGERGQTNSGNARILRTIGPPTPPGRIPNIFDFYLRRHRWQKWEYDGDPLKFSQIPGRNLKISSRANEFIPPPH